MSSAEQAPAAAATGFHGRTRAQLAATFQQVRARTERLMAPLTAEDFRAQPIEEVSPPYWNLGHTSWFFAANLLRRFERMPQGFDALDYALNSYYEGLGPRLARADRGRVASPSTELVRRYRAAVDDATRAWIEACPADHLDETARLVRIGCEHEQQHQELFVTEILFIRWSAPEGLRRAYLPPRAWVPGAAASAGAQSGAARAVEVAAAETTLGYQGRSIRDGGFCWDNETPAHRAVVGDYQLADRLVTNREWLAFVDEGGYRDPLLWLSNGWDAKQRQGLEAPLYWTPDGAGGFTRFTLRGEAPLDLDAPVCHVSFYEADAFCRWYGEQLSSWRGARLPREVEWEHAARLHDFHDEDANLLRDDPESSALDVEPATQPANQSANQPANQPAGPIRQLRGTAWEWTLSHYEPYPGYHPFEGALMEYNGKFMDNQRVLRGGSFATPRSQARVAYRNFWPPNTRFQASGLRVCADR